jgi:PAS domain S-box-containing protein
MTSYSANNRRQSERLARNWTIRGLTASLIVVAALLPVVSALSINFWLDGGYHWREAALELGVACLTLALIAYPAFHLLNWEAAQASKWDETRRDFQVIINQVVDMVLLVSLQGRIIDANQNACDSLGYQKSELTRLAILDLDIDSYLQRHPELVSKLHQGENVSFESRYRCKSGRRIPVECRVRVASWLEEPHYVQFVSDISHRREVEKAIDDSREALEKTRNLLEIRVAEHSTEIRKQKQSREMVERYADSIQHYLEKLIDSMPSAIIGVDEQYRVMQWNIEAEKMTNVAAKMAIGEELVNLFPALVREIKNAVAKKDLFEQSVSFRFKTMLNHQSRTLEVMIYPIFTLLAAEQGEVIRIDDVTEKLKIDETLVQTEKMLSLGGLAAGMAHEINNPLGAIMQSTQNIQRRLTQILPRNQMIAQECHIDLQALEDYLKKQRIFEFLDGIMTSGERAAHIVGDMLSFARPANQEAKPIDLVGAMDAAVRLAEKDYNQRKSFDFREIEIRRSYSPDIGRVMAQKNQLEQVFLNLLINAAQALSLVTKTRFSPLIELIIRREGANACIEVIDNGPGMDEATRKRVFEPFFTTKDEKTGTGLGLSVSYFIVCEQLGGQLSVESQLAQGSRFTIYLPLFFDAEHDAHHDEQIELPLG